MATKYLKKLKKKYSNCEHNYRILQANTVQYVLHTYLNLQTMSVYLLLVSMCIIYLLDHCTKAYYMHLNDFYLKTINTNEK